MIAYFQRTGSCSVCVRAFRQCRSRLCSARVERVPASSNSLLVAAMAISVESTLASADCDLRVRRPFRRSDWLDRASTARPAFPAAPGRRAAAASGRQPPGSCRDPPRRVPARYRPTPGSWCARSDRLIECRLRDARVDSRLNDLEDRAVGGRVIISLVARHQVRLRHLDIVDQHGAADSVVRWPNDDQSSITVRPGASRSAIAYQARPSLIERDDRNQMREQCTGRIELASASRSHGRRHR